MEDESIITLFFERDERAVAETDKKYRGLCLGISKRIVGSDCDAEECFSDALMALWRSVPPERPENLRAYLCRIVRNLSLTRLDYNLAKKRNSGAEVSLTEFEEFLPDGAARDALDRVDLSALFDAFLSTLAPEQRKVFVKRYFFYETIAEISEEFGMSGSKVKSMLLRTRKKLKAYLTEKECNL